MSSQLFDKMQLNKKVKSIVLLNIPDELKWIWDEANKRFTCYSMIEDIDKSDEIVIFISSLKELMAFTEILEMHFIHRWKIWIAYPKADVKGDHHKFTTVSGWEVLQVLGYKPGRPANINEKWTILRFVAHTNKPVGEPDDDEIDNNFDWLD